MTNKQLLILFVIGMVLTIAGALFKIMHWPLASLLLIVGMTFEGVSIVLLIVKLFRKDSNGKGFLDS